MLIAERTCCHELLGLTLSITVESSSDFDTSVAFRLLFEEMLVLGFRLGDLDISMFGLSYMFTVGFFCGHYISRQSFDATFLQVLSQDTHLCRNELLSARFPAEIQTYVCERYKM